MYQYIKYKKDSYITVECKLELLQNHDARTLEDIRPFSYGCEKRAKRDVIDLWEIYYIKYKISFEL